MRILHVIHDFLPRHRAGSEIYASELARALAARGHQLHVLCAEYDPSRYHGSLEWRWYHDLPVTELVNNWDFASFEESYASERLNHQLEHVLAAVEPDILHIHNLVNLSFELPAMAAARGIPSVATVHEYALLCPSSGQRVHLAEQHLCLEIDPERCARCFPQSAFGIQMASAAVARRTGRVRPLWSLLRRLRLRFPALATSLARAAQRVSSAPAVTPEHIRRRLAAARQVFAALELVVSPSAALGAELMRHGLAEGQVEVSDYGFPALVRPAPTPGDSRLRIGFVGTLCWHKGVHVLVEATRLLPRDGYEVILFGSVDTFPDYVARLREAARGLAVRFAGGFERSQVAEVYAQMDVLVVPSLWLENSPLVIHEAFQTALPVVAAAIGGIPELVKDGSNGLLCEPASATALAAALRRLHDEPGLIDRLRSSPTLVKTIAEDAAEWEARYRRVLSRHQREAR